jgi:hypothetical protein
VQPLGGFFQQIKVRQTVGRKVSIQTVIQISKRLYQFLNEAAQNFEGYLNIHK